MLRLLAANLYQAIELKPIAPLIDPVDQAVLFEVIAFWHPWLFWPVIPLPDPGLCYRCNQIPAAAGPEF